MKRLIFLILVFWSALLLADDKSLVTIKSSSVSGGVVILTVSEAGKTYDLQCTKTAPFCQTPEAGSYWMVRLPKNHGVYDCDNVDLYPQSTDAGTGNKVGEYCITGR
jgi:hypothetical protein